MNNIRNKNERNFGKKSDSDSVKSSVKSQKKLIRQLSNNLKNLKLIYSSHNSQRQSENSSGVYEGVSEPQSVKYYEDEKNLLIKINKIKVPLVHFLNFNVYSVRTPWRYINKENSLRNNIHELVAFFKLLQKLIQNYNINYNLSQFSCYNGYKDNKDVYLDKDRDSNVDLNNYQRDSNQNNYQPDKENNYNNCTSDKDNCEREEELEYEFLVNFCNNVYNKIEVLFRELTPSELSAGQIPSLFSLNLDSDLVNNKEVLGEFRDVLKEFNDSDEKRNKKGLESSRENLKREVMDNISSNKNVILWNNRIYNIKNFGIDSRRMGYQKFVVLDLVCEGRVREEFLKEFGQQIVEVRLNKFRWPCFPVLLKVLSIVTFWTQFDDSSNLVVLNYNSMNFYILLIFSLIIVTNSSYGYSCSNYGCQVNNNNNNDYKDKRMMEKILSDLEFKLLNTLKWRELCNEYNIGLSLNRKNKSLFSEKNENNLNNITKMYSIKIWPPSYKRYLLYYISHLSFLNRDNMDNSNNVDNNMDNSNNNNNNNHSKEQMDMMNYVYVNNEMNKRRIVESKSFVLRDITLINCLLPNSNIDIEVYRVNQISNLYNYNHINANSPSNINNYKDSGYKDNGYGYEREYNNCNSCNSYLDEDKKDKRCVNYNSIIYNNCKCNYYRNSPSDSERLVKADRGEDDVVLLSCPYNYAKEISINSHSSFSKGGGDNYPNDKLLDLQMGLNKGLDSSYTDRMIYNYEGDNELVLSGDICVVFVASSKKPNRKSICTFNFNTNFISCLENVIKSDSEELQLVVRPTDLDLYNSNDLFLSNNSLIYINLVSLNYSPNVTLNNSYRNEDYCYFVNGNVYDFINNHVKFVESQEVVTLLNLTGHSIETVILSLKVCPTFVEALNLLVRLPKPFHSNYFNNQIGNDYYSKSYSSELISPETPKDKLSPRKEHLVDKDDNVLSQHVTEQNKDSNVLLRSPNKNGLLQHDYNKVLLQDNPNNLLHYDGYVQYNEQKLLKLDERGDGYGLKTISCSTTNDNIPINYNLTNNLVSSELLTSDLVTPELVNPELLTSKLVDPEFLKDKLVNPELLKYKLVSQELLTNISTDNKLLLVDKTFPPPRSQQGPPAAPPDAKAGYNGQEFENKQNIRLDSIPSNAMKDISSKNAKSVVDIPDTILIDDSFTNDRSNLLSSENREEGDKKEAKNDAIVKKKVPPIPKGPIKMAKKALPLGVKLHWKPLVKSKLSRSIFDLTHLSEESDSRLKVFDGLFGSTPELKSEVIDVLSVKKLFSRSSVDSNSTVSKVDSGLQNGEVGGNVGGPKRSKSSSCITEKSRQLSLLDNKRAQNVLIILRNYSDLLEYLYSLNSINTLSFLSINSCNTATSCNDSSSTNKEDNNSSTNKEDNKEEEVEEIEILNENEMIEIVNKLFIVYPSHSEATLLFSNFNNNIVTNLNNINHFILSTDFGGCNVDDNNRNKDDNNNNKDNNNNYKDKNNNNNELILNILNVMNYRYVEKLIILLALKRNFYNKLKLVKLVHNTNLNLKTISEQLDTFSRAVDETKNSCLLPLVFNVFLRYGNYINFGNSESGISGFTLSSSLKLFDFKSPTSSFSLLHFIIINLYIKLYLANSRSDSSDTQVELDNNYNNNYKQDNNNNNNKDNNYKENGLDYKLLNIDLELRNVLLCQRMKTRDISSSLNELSNELFNILVYFNNLGHPGNFNEACGGTGDEELFGVLLGNLDEGTKKKLNELIDRYNESENANSVSSKIESIINIYKLKLNRIVQHKNQVFSKIVSLWSYLGEDLSSSSSTLVTTEDNNNSSNNNVSNDSNNNTNTNHISNKEENDNLELEKIFIILGELVKCIKKVFLDAKSKPLKYLVVLKNPSDQALFLTLFMDHKSLNNYYKSKSFNSSSNSGSNKDKDKLINNKDSNIINKEKEEENKKEKEKEDEV